MKMTITKSTCGKLAALAIVAVGVAEGAVLEAVKASCRRQLACSDERIREIVRFSEALVGESGAAKRSADEWQKANDERAARLVATQRDDGSWPDVDYVNMTRSMFNAVRHLYNMRAIARSPRTPEKERALHKALAFWLDGGFRNPNWWWNQIGVPLPLGTVALLMDDILSAEERARVVKALRVSKIGMTGQNRVWFAECVLYRALLEGNEADAKAAHAAILDEFKISKTVEGIQDDWSFHQHGNQAQFGNYGASYITTMTRLLAIFNGTPWAVPDEKRQVLEKLVVNGYMPIIWRGSLDMGALGRRIGPGVARTKGALALSVAAALGVSTNVPAGLHWFPKSACGVYRGKDWMASVKCETASITGKERGNNDNLLGAHSADGALFTYVTGDEYRDVFPLWNWRHIPGITSYDEKKVDWKSRNRSKVCERDGDTVRFVLDRAGLKATTVWRFSEVGVDVSVTDISSEKDKPVVTTVEQSIAQPNAKWWNEEGGIVAVNGSIRYELPSNAIVRIEKRTGSWKDSMEELSDEKVSGLVFEIVIPHGRRPAGASCSWRVRPQGKEIQLYAGTASSVWAEKGMKLLWSDEFDYADSRLEEKWVAENKAPTHILCSRWRENAVVTNGMLRLCNRKESRGGKEWTSASVWTKKKFKYGYFECRYRYAAATGTNNSFWFVTFPHGVDEGFEIDVNEGHYPSKINTNIHEYDKVSFKDGKKKHKTSSKALDLGRSFDLSKEFHVYGFLWTADELVFYFDGKEIRRIKNEVCHSECPIFLSEAIIKWAGPVTDAIDGTFMEVDYVRAYGIPGECP